MPKVQVNGLTMNYEEQGSGEPIVLIPFLSADNACYAFQVPEYCKHFKCISIDPRDTGETDKPDGEYSTETLADDVAAFMQTVGIDRAHVFGLSLGAATAMQLAVRHPQRVKSLSLHSAWPKTDSYIKAAITGWQAMAKGLDSVTEMVITGIFPWCLTPDLYVEKPDLIETLSEFVRSRPEQPVDAFIRQSNAVISHDVESHLRKIAVPTQITFGRHDAITSLRFAEPLTANIPDNELVVFEECSHAPIFEDTAGFNQKTLEFLQRHTG
ncbi:MAG TPA: alpha/beta hydrolase [Pyrinomonadaceae bacterium]